MNIPEGWKLVPVEPTPVMTAAYSVAAEELTKRHLLSGSYPATWQPIEAGYAAMLAAAPTPPAATLRLPEPMTKAELLTIRMKARASPEAETTNWPDLACRAVEAEVIRRLKEANAEARRVEMLRKLGARLAGLLDEDQFAECEALLLAAGVMPEEKDNVAKLDVVTLTGEEYDDLMECKGVVTSLLAQLSAAKDRIAELTPVAGTDWRETMQRMLTRMNEAGQWPAICDKARAVLSSANDAAREPAAYLWGGCLWRTDEMGRGRPGAVELYRAQTPLTDADITALLPIWQQGAWTLPDYGRWVARAVERAHGIKTTPNLCRLCGHSIDAHDKQYGCAEDGCDCETPNNG